MIQDNPQWWLHMLTDQCTWLGWHRESAASVLNHWSLLPPEPSTAVPDCDEREVEANRGSEQQPASCAPSTCCLLRTGSLQRELPSTPRPPGHDAAPQSPTARFLWMPWSSASSATLGMSLHWPPSPGRWTLSPRSGRFSFSRGAICWTYWARRPSAAERGCTRPDNHGCPAGAGWEATHL